MPRTQLQVTMELKRLRNKLRQADDAMEALDVLDDIDELLDERLEQKGAHPPDCSCNECDRRVADVLARRLGECADPRDTAGVDEFGPLG
jgi:hypothetical protein